MSDDLQSPTPDASGEDLLVHLAERAHMINRVHMALRSTLQLEDIYSIVLATLVSQRGLDFSRAIIFEYQDRTGVFKGLSALGPTDTEAYERLQREIVEEEKALADMMQSLGHLEDSQDEERLFSQSLRELSDHSYWITTFQKFNEVNELDTKIKQIEFPWRAQGRRPDQPHMDFIDRLAGQDSCLLCHGTGNSQGVPEAVDAILEGASLWAAIKTRKGVRAIIVVDKIFQDAPIDQNDALRMDWFSSQIALALENAEMFTDLHTAYESLREIELLKGNFLSTISHELRTPLTAITGFLQLLLNQKIGELAPAQSDILTRMMGHAEHLSNKVNDLIEIAEMDAGLASEHTIMEVDPLEVIITTLNRIEHKRAQKSITIEPDLSRQIPRILSNADALGRIFFHLIDNAIKFSPRGGTVRIGFEVKDNDLAISVADEGIGIADAHQQKIFDAFYQVDNNLTRSYEGMGVGLTIIKRQLDMTGGQITMSSRPNEGATFTIIYPLA